MVATAAIRWRSTATIGQVVSRCPISSPYFNCTACATRFVRQHRFDAGNRRNDFEAQFFGA